VHDVCPKQVTPSQALLPAEAKAGMLNTFALTCAAAGKVKTGARCMSKASYAIASPAASRSQSGYAEHFCFNMRCCWQSQNWCTMYVQSKLRHLKPCHRAE